MSGVPDRHHRRSHCRCATATEEFVLRFLTMCASSSTTLNHRTLNSGVSSFVSVHFAYSAATVPYVVTTTSCARSEVSSRKFFEAP